MAIADIKKKMEEFRRLYVDQDLCIGCGACVAVDETETFYMQDNGKAITKPNNLDNEDLLMICPTEAIKVNEKNKDDQ